LFINRGLKQGGEMLKKKFLLMVQNINLLLMNSQPVNTYTSISGVGKSEISNLNHAEKNF